MLPLPCRAASSERYCFHGLMPVGSDRLYCRPLQDSRGVKTASALSQLHSQNFMRYVLHSDKASTIL